MSFAVLKTHALSLPGATRDIKSGCNRAAGQAPVPGTLPKKRHKEILG